MTRLLLRLLALACALHTSPCAAHVLQYLSWFRIERTMEISADEVRLTYDCQFDPAVFRASDPLMDLDADSTASDREKAAFCVQAAQYLAQDLILFTSGTQLALREESFFLLEGATGFRSQLAADLPITSGTAELVWIDPAFIPGGFSTQPQDRGSTISGYAQTHSERLSFIVPGGGQVKRVPLAREVRTLLQIEVKPALAEKDSGGNKQHQP